MIDFKGKKVLVLGAGKTGKSAALFCKNKGAIVALADEQSIGEIHEDIQKVVCVFSNLNPKDYDLIIQSPGISRQHPFLLDADRAGILVIGEIQLASFFAKQPIIAITGTNGKTTITYSLGHLFKICKKTTELVGNVGFPFVDVVENDVEQFVLEVSSYQLEIISDFKPHIAIMSNLTPDHLERHKTMDNYFAIKKHIYINMDNNDFLIVNGDDSYMSTIKNQSHAFTVYEFSTKAKVQGIYLEGETIYLNVDGKPRAVFSRDDLKIIGNHNVENIMAAYLAAYLSGCDSSCLKEGIKTFEGVPHRLEYITTINGIRYYNDSKSTNPEATITALQAFSGEQVYIILGGSSKEVSYESLGTSVKLSNAIPIVQGATKVEIKEALIKANVKNILEADTVKDALLLATKLGKEGDVVLLSPACASFDQYANFEKRGDRFKEYVYDLK